ncbi:hypothetical protein K1T71_004138 [Dendrolimus kikuchii]|uniref:Uncharacterized protein n=1 Tax=Dendrolimus kikuchii TaxID=765133 RepID=A0ACC1D9Y9_9NEOP|nr:hypothetical protein K1T71_004138 [Dendrolimus kikuchii]
MDTTVPIKPMNMLELFPDLNAILTEDAKLNLTAKKKPRPTTMMQKTLTSEKDYKPMNLNEMWDDLKSLRVPSSKEQSQIQTANKKRWNSSIKVDKRKSLKADGKLQKSTVRKVLDFQTKPKVQNSKMKITSETPKFPKPDLNKFKQKKTVLKQVPAHNTIRISGICNIPETPDVINNPIKSRMTITNKENRQFILPKPINSKKIIKPPLVPNTPLTNESWKSSCDDSFLQREKEIDDYENKVFNENKVNNVTPQVSTPYTKHRNIQEYFDNSSNFDDSAAYKDNTIMCFDKPKNSIDNNKREESVIVSLCDLLDKATVTDVERTSTLDDLLNMEKDLEQNSIIIEKTIKMLNELKESKTKSLKFIRRLIKEKKESISNHEKPLAETKDFKVVKAEKINEEVNPMKSKPCSVIKSCIRTPTYKIPRRSPCLKKMVLYKSMPNQLNEMHSPKIDMGKRALSVYMEMKQHMNFLNTPLKRPENTTGLSTPAVTSHNLQIQLEKLYDDL